MENKSQKYFQIVSVLTPVFLEIRLTSSIGPGADPPSGPLSDGRSVSNSEMHFRT